nr:probable leucine-rich repeat receptor-like protein kinase At1g35710 [Tanacetum cinerariifolium]
MRGSEMIHVEMVMYQLGLESLVYIESNCVFTGKYIAVSISGPFPTAVTNLLDLTRLDLHRTNSTSNQAFEAS